MNGEYYARLTAQLELVAQVGGQREHLLLRDKGFSSAVRTPPIYEATRLFRGHFRTPQGRVLEVSLNVPYGYVGTAVDAARWRIIDSLQLRVVTLKDE